MKLPRGRLGVVLFVVSIAGISCSRGGGVVAPDNDADATAAESSAAVQASSRSRDAIWADCEPFGTVGTPTDFDPNHGNFDKLFHGAFKDGFGAISESKPGDQDFNGGRWEVWDPNGGLGDKYADACSYEDLDEADFHKTGEYFECPLLPAPGYGKKLHH
jgi:hypothetical protein